MSILDGLVRLNESKDALKLEINKKGGDITTESMDTYSYVIPALPFEAEDPNINKNRVRFFDFNGDLISTQYLESGASAIAPTAPDHSDIGIVFHSWNNEFDGVLRNVDVGAVYDTYDNKTHLHIEINKASTKILSANIVKIGTGNITVEWGDGNSDSYSVSNISMSHTYMSYGNYIIKISSDINTKYRFLIDATEISFNLKKIFIGNGYDLTNSEMGNAQYKNCMVTAEYLTLPSNMPTSIQSYKFFTGTNVIPRLRTLIIPSGVISIGDGAFNNLYSLKNLILPSTLNGNIGSGAFSGARSLESLIFSWSMTGTFGSQPFTGCSKLKELVFPPDSKLGSGAGTFQLMSDIERIVYPLNFTGAFNSFVRLSSLTKLREIVFPQNMTGNIYKSAFIGLESLDSINLPQGLTGSIETKSFQNLSNIKHISIPGGLSGTIGDRAFSGMIRCLVYDFSNHTSVPSLSSANVFDLSYSPVVKIKVPLSLYDSWIANTSWLPFVNYIEGV